MKSNKGRSKYGNKKIESNGVKFDSKLELYCFNMLRNLGFEFEFQKKIVIVEKFRYNGEGIRELTIVVDFVLNYNGKTIYIDTKGFPTEVSKLKYKLLKNKIKDEENTIVIWLHSEKEVNQFLINLKEEKNVNNKQSYIAW